MPCSLASRAPMHLQVTQANNVLRLRVLATQSVRVLSIERAESGLRDLPRRSGLARWQDDELVVETMAPAFSLWGHLHAAVHGSMLTESFSLTSDGMLVYRTWYTPPGGSVRYGPHETQLARCTPLR